MIARALARPRWEQLVETLEMARSDALEEVESDEEIDLLGGAQTDATWALLIAPAPDVGALALKLEVFRDEEAYRLNDECVHKIIHTMIADARRLSIHRLGWPAERGTSAPPAPHPRGPERTG